MKAFHFFLIAVVLLLVFPTFVSSDDGSPDPLAADLTPSQRLEALLDRMRARHESLETLEADFVQSKDSVMFVEPGVASGVFSYAAPERVLWQYEEPDPISVLIADGRMTTWYHDLERAEIAGVGGRSRRILEYMGASASVETLLEYFNVSLRRPEASGAPFRLQLTPRYERVEKRVRDLEIWIDSELYLPVRLRFVEGDGDVTEYEFSELRLNQGLPDGRFVLDIPDGVEVRTVDLGGDPPSGQ